MTVQVLQKVSLFPLSEVYLIFRNPHHHHILESTILLHGLIYQFLDQL